MGVAGPRRPEQDGCDGVVARCSGLLLSQDRRQVAVTEDQHSVGDLRPGGAGSSRLRLPALGCPSQAINQVNVLVAGLHGRCPCLSAVSPTWPGERTDM